MKNWLKEPLTHFVILGTLLFMGHGLWAKHVSRGDYQIEISKAEMERQLKIFAVENNRHPTQQEEIAIKLALFEDKVLIREAIRLGLNDDDAIIHKRLIQKMRFMIEDKHPSKLADSIELEAWFNDNKERFTRPAARSFRHVYISPTNGQEIDARLISIQSQISEDNWRTIGDPFNFPSQYDFLDRTAVARQFGARFAQAVFEIDLGVWSTPIKSGFGLHLVYVDEERKQTTPKFKEAIVEIQESWLKDETKISNRKALEALLEQYDPIDVE